MGRAEQGTSPHPVRADFWRRPGPPCQEAAGSGAGQSRKAGRAAPKNLGRTAALLRACRCAKRPGTSRPAAGPRGRTDCPGARRTEPLPTAGAWENPGGAGKPLAALGAGRLSLSARGERRRRAGDGGGRAELGLRPEFRPEAQPAAAAAAAAASAAARPASPGERGGSRRELPVCQVQHRAGAGQAVPRPPGGLGALQGPDQIHLSEEPGVWLGRGALGAPAHLSEAGQAEGRCQGQLLREVLPTQPHQPRPASASELRGVNPGGDATLTAGAGLDPHNGLPSPREHPERGAAQECRCRGRGQPHPTCPGGACARVAPDRRPVRAGHRPAPCDRCPAVLVEAPRERPPGSPGLRATGVDVAATRRGSHLQPRSRCGRCLGLGSLRWGRKGNRVPGFRNVLLSAVALFTDLSLFLPTNQGVSWQKRLLPLVNFLPQTPP